MNTKGRPRNKGVAFTGEKISALYEEGLSNSTVLRQEAYCKGTECLMAGDGHVKAVRTLVTDTITGSTHRWGQEY